MRSSVSRILERRGYTVLEASNGLEAIALFQANKAVDLVLTDIIMPDVGGRELVRRLRAIDPELRVVYMSGYASDEVLRDELAISGTPFLSKPFSAETLVATINDVLSRVLRAG